MKKEITILFVLMVGLFSILVACSGTNQTPQSSAPEVTESAAAKVTESDDETMSKVSVTVNSSVHSSDLGGYAWLQEYLSSNDLEAAEKKFWSESAREGAVCYASIAPSFKSEPSTADGSVSISFEAEPGKTFRIMCDPDETHPGALSVDVFTVPPTGGIIDHAIAGIGYPALLTPELGVTNQLAAQAAGYAGAEEMFKLAGTCRVLALPGEGATVSVSDGEAYGFFMEAPDTAGRVTILEDPSPAGAYIVVKEFGEGESESEIELEFTDTSGSGLTWPTTTCPIMKGFSTHLEVLPYAPTEESENETSGDNTVSSLETGKSEEVVSTEETKATGPRTGDIAPDFSLPDSNGEVVHLAKVLKNNQSVVLVFYLEYG
jgi:hypothetical protein